jgi:hypothetical protein
MITYYIVNWHGATKATAIIVAHNRNHAIEQLRKWIKEDGCPVKPESEWYIDRCNVITIIME